MKRQQTRPARAPAREQKTAGAPAREQKTAGAPAREQKTAGAPARAQKSVAVAAREQEPKSERADYAEKLEGEKRASTLQLLFKAARLLDEQALLRVAAQPGRVRLRRSHTSLLPHIDLAGTRITDLAERLGVSKQAASQLVDDLEQLGVLARVPDPEDARARRVIFTELGRAGLLEGLSVLRAMERELGARIGERKMEQLRGTLLAILGELSAP
jgi:DNA-binding MarR family transcriptional regulator